MLNRRGEKTTASRESQNVLSVCKWEAFHWLEELIEQKRSNWNHLCCKHTVACKAARESEQVHRINWLRYAIVQLLSSSSSFCFTIDGIAIELWTWESQSSRPWKPHEVIYPDLRKSFTRARSWCTLRVFILCEIWVATELKRNWKPFELRVEEWSFFSLKGQRKELESSWSQNDFKSLIIL